MRCPHCGEDPKIDDIVISNIRSYGSTPLVRAECCGKGIVIHQQVTFVAEADHSGRSEDDWGDSLKVTGRSDYDIYQDNIHILMRKFPKAFNKRKPLPLIKDHFERLDSLNILSRENLRACLAVWTNRMEYIREVAYGVYHFDLNGMVDRTISREDKHKARDIYEEKNTLLYNQRKRKAS